MITVSVRLYGTLPGAVKGYPQQKELTVSLEPDARVNDLIRHLGLREQGVVAAVDSRIINDNEPLADGACVRLLQAAHGG